MPLNFLAQQTLNPVKNHNAFYLKLGFNLESYVITAPFHVEALEIHWGFLFCFVFNRAPVPPQLYHISLLESLLLM